MIRLCDSTVVRIIVSYSSVRDNESDCFDFDDAVDCAVGGGGSRWLSKLSSVGIPRVELDGGGAVPVSLDPPSRPVLCDRKSKQCFFHVEKNHCYTLFIAFYSSPS